ncbi:MAG: YbaB/EbfC family nucleoid-associated protein [Treponema sp.]
MNPFDMMKNLSGMKDQLAKIQSEMADVTATGSSGGNMVNVTINGKFEVISVKLDPVCVDNRDVPMLQDLIVAASHDANSKMQEIIKQKAGPMLQGMNIPGMNL